MEPKSQQMHKKRLWLGIVGGIILLIVVGGILYWQFGTVGPGSDQTAQTETIRSENQTLLNQVQKHILLPEGEEPTIATIDNAEDLARLQDFFNQSQNGDKLIIYPQAKRAFIYNPDRDIIISAGPTYFENTQPAKATSTSENTTQSNQPLSNETVP